MIIEKMFDTFSNSAFDNKFECILKLKKSKYNNNNYYFIFPHKKWLKNSYPSINKASIPLIIVLAWPLVNPCPSKSLTTLYVLKQYCKSCAFFIFCTVVKSFVFGLSEENWSCKNGQEEKYLWIGGILCSRIMGRSTGNDSNKS